MNIRNIPPLAGEVLKKRYLARNYRGEIIETPASLFSRVARVVAEADRLFDAGASVRKTADRFEAAMTSLSFLPNSPCLMNAGRPMGQLAACFVLPLEDNLESIFQSLKNAALIHHSGGGTGFSFSRLRPSGDTIFPASGVTGGPVSFIQLFDAATQLIDRNQVRPGANMGVLHASHPDIESFISAKHNRQGQLHNFNLSVAVDDEFIACVKADRDYPLLHPRTGAVIGHKSAAELLDKMAYSAWLSGDPGILFIDHINRDNPTPKMGALEATNPCGEQPLLPYESCTLGSINLTRILDDAVIDFGRLESLVRLAVHFLDNVVEVNRHPIPQTEEWSRMNRKIGLGVMGFADLLILLGIPYESERAVTLAEQIMSRIQQYAESASAELAARRGNFPAFHQSVFADKGVTHRRNATLTTVAPTGTISILAGVSSSVEPVFAFDVRRRVIDEVHADMHPIYAQYRREGRFIDPDIFQTAWDISPRSHLKIQAAFQKHTDNAVSKTVNLPHTITMGEIRDLFMDAADMNLKGITVYRDQSNPDQILSTCSLRNKACSYVNIKETER